MALVFLGLGSNLQDRLDNLNQAITLLSELEQTTVTAVSNYYESPALLKEGAPEEWNKPFINAVAAIETEIEPEALFSALQQIEVSLGKEKLGEWAPRTIDMDILTYGDLICDYEELTIPHPRATERDFVLLPWREIAADFIHPVYKQSIATLCDKLSQISALPLEKEVA